MPNDTIVVSIDHFGAFKAYGKNTQLMIADGSNLSCLKAALIDCLGEDAASLVQDSAFADGQSILSDDHVFSAGAELCILPPVCGG